MTDANPLLRLTARLPFDRVAAEHVEPAIDALLVDARARMRAIVESEGPRTYANTLGALDEMAAPLEDAMSVADHLESVLGDPALREAYNAVQPKVSAFYSSIPLDAGLWAALCAFAETKEAAALDPTRARFLKKTVDDFRRHGAELPAASKETLQALEVELSEITTKFAQNVVDATDAYELVITDEASLAGLPESARAAAKASADTVEATGWRFTLQAPSLLAVMTQLDDPAIREQTWRAYNTRATSGEHDNRAIQARILELRAQKAALLGYADVADLLLEPRMVKNGSAAAAFVSSLEARTRSFFDAEHTSLSAFRRDYDGGANLRAWDLAYYAHKQRKALFDIDHEALRPYFGADGVLAGMFEIVRRLYGIEVRACDDLPTWHESVQVYAVDDADGATIGRFYADLYPRPGKRGGAWMRPLLTGDRATGEPHVAVMCANVTPAVGDRPALLTHREDETLFHEFGHLLHHLLTKVEVRSLAGTNVAWDFVELPSQIMENWCWARESLNLFARHYETGEPIPDDLFDRLTRARTFRAGHAQMRQLGFATVDLALHREYDPASDGAVLDYARGIASRFSPTPLPDDHSMLASFTHLFASPTGYAAGYYSYKWAEVLDADAFTRFEGEGLFSPKVGAEFRDRVLARGNSRDPARLYEDFMGRGPDPEALMRRAGLA